MRLKFIHPFHFYLKSYSFGPFTLRFSGISEHNLGASDFVFIYLSKQSFEPQL